MLHFLRKNLFLSFFLIVELSCAQKTSNRPHCEDKIFDKTVASLINFSVPLISVKELNDTKSNYTILDAREPKEFEISHLEGAKNIGYDNFSLKNVENIPRNTPIVVYCSIGYRSEKIGEKLKSAGFTNVKNLYGSIFEWVNQGYPIVNNTSQNTTKIHTYNQLWSRWVKNKNIEKTW
jgi:rhodanese-related sulfurtransferase